MPLGHWGSVTGGGSNPAQVGTVAVSWEPLTYVTSRSGMFTRWLGSAFTGATRYTSWMPGENGRSLPDGALMSVMAVSPLAGPLRGDRVSWPSFG
ncbi:hypothetical protein COSO111634_38430 [Corallococcus soli]